MKDRMLGAILLAGIAAAACSSDEGAEAPGRDTARTAAVADTAATAHTGHAMPGTDSAAAHAGHAMPGADSTSAHAGHAMPGTPSTGAHAGHGTGTTAGSTAHAGHTAGAANQPNAHAGHTTGAGNRQTTHAGHAGGATNRNAHAGHDVGAGNRQAHAGHAAANADAHAGHRAEAAAGHADHRPARANANAHAGHQANAADRGTTTNAHAGHQANADRPASNAHADHRPAQANANAHAGHQADRPTSNANAHAGHQANAAGRPTTNEHAGHATARRDTAHAGHHANDRPTTNEHAGHAQAPPAAPPHAGHHPPAAPPAAKPDPAHAGHAGAADTHAGHRVPAAGANAHAGHASAGHGAGAQHGVEHTMLDVPLGGGWRVMGMAQAYPIVTAGDPFGEEDSPLKETEFYLTQPAAMINLESPGSRLVLRTTLNFEALTQENGELTFGGWGEGFIDKRHPHTLLHEAMLSLNVWNAPGGAFSLSAGKGFAPYGTDDPMSRPGAKYPTNHHLSQALERWTLNGVYLLGPWSVEAGLFGGAEPEGPYDFSNIESFGDSWSARLARRFGGTGTSAPWELSVSTADIAETHHGEKERTRLFNGAVRHNARYGVSSLYALLEGSLSDPEGEDDGYFSVLGETLLSVGPHQPYLRMEYATRPEYEREGAPGTDDFFRYHHDDDAIGATRWLIGTVGYAYEATNHPFSARPFVEAQFHRVSGERGGIDPEALFGSDAFWSFTAGFRLFFGGGPMRMGSYGVLDDMTTMHRGGHGAAAEGTAGRH